MEIDSAYRMTIKEVLIILTGQRNREHRKWEHTREVLAKVNNAGIIARGTKVTASMLTSPRDIIKLPWDKDGKVLSEEDTKPPKQLYELAEKCGVINKERKSLKEIFKAS